MSAMPLTAARKRTSRDFRFVPIGDLSRCSSVLRLLDHLVSKLLEMQRHVEAEHLGGLEVDDQLELGGQLYRYVGRVVALKYFIYDGARATPHIINARRVGHQATSINIFSLPVDRRQRSTSCKCNKPAPRRKQ